ncbi:A/G-specific adenine glycosylase [Demequina sediminicola]|uniref:A/G-specific adenine glycosylase n=1 Tax=Demequina sediminicola TaxID=1095026 RepID=UPI0007847729|nr:A/G-specific adenine glycosylase [Demequina sediminicola]
MPHDSAIDPRVSEVIDWFAREARDLPWRREDCSAWGVLVSEVMLQQTPVARVEPVWRRWLDRWPTPAALAASSQADAVRAWDRLGYPRRAKRLWECAHTLVERHGGEVPRDPDALLALPGVGDYTANAILAFAFGERAVVLDTNVRRVIGRAWRAQPLPTAHMTRAEREQAAALVPASARLSVEWNAGSMELGALVCTARAPRCGECPLRDECAWVAAGSPGLDEAPRRTQAWHGTDRQVRGRMMALLRAADAPVVLDSHPDLGDVEAEQRERCLESLVRDGLIQVQESAPATYTL